MERLLFLDVDGVLNNDDWAWRLFEDYGIKVYQNNILYQPALIQLRRIINATGAKIILSSSWRRFPEAKADLERCLKMYDMTIDNETPILDRHKGYCRGDAISKWFKAHPGEYKYVILDDEDNMGEHMAHLVRTNWFAGLTEVEANKCIDMLNGGNNNGQDV